MAVTVYCTGLRVHCLTITKSRGQNKNMASIAILSYSIDKHILTTVPEEARTNVGGVIQAEIRDMPAFIVE